MPNQRLTDLGEIRADDLSHDDCLLVSDVWDDKAEGAVSKRMSVFEFLKYVREHIKDTKFIPSKPTRFAVTEQKWRCRRCKAIVDMVKFRCKCKESPSPWEPI